MTVQRTCDKLISKILHQAQRCTTRPLAEKYEFALGQSPERFALMEIDPLWVWFKSFKNSLRAQSLYKLSIRPDSPAPNSWYKIVLKEYEANNNDIF
jgi:hypothetical protein